MVIHNTDKEMKCKIKIFVASHKPDKVYHDNVYTPIHVGRSISRYKDEMADMIGDNTGDNISEKNPTYSGLDELLNTLKLGLESSSKKFT